MNWIILILYKFVPFYDSVRESPNNLGLPSAGQFQNGVYKQIHVQKK